MHRRVAGMRYAGSVAGSGKFSEYAGQVERTEAMALPPERLKTAQVPNPLTRSVVVDMCSPSSSVSSVSSTRKVTGPHFEQSKRLDCVDVLRGMVDRKSV